MLSSLVSLYKKTTTILVILYTLKCTSLHHRVSLMSFATLLSKR